MTKDGNENTIDTLLSEMTPTARVYNPVSMLVSVNIFLHLEL